MAAPPAAGAVQAAPLAPTAPPALRVAAPPAPLTTAQACALARAHAPYVQMGSITASAGAAAGVFERESVLLSEKRSPYSTQASPCVPSMPSSSAPVCVLRAAIMHTSYVWPSGRHCHFAAYCPRLMWQVPALSLLVYVPHACLAEVLRHQAATRTCAISELQRANACK